MSTDSAFRVLLLTGLVGSLAPTVAAQDPLPRVAPTRKEQPTQDARLDPAATALAAAAAARKQAERYGPATVRVVDVRDLVDDRGLLPASDKTDIVPTKAPTRRTVKELASFCSRFVEPALAPGEEIAAIGPAHLVMRANPASQTSILATLAELRSRRDEQVALELKVVELSELDYQATLAQHMRGSFRTASQPLHTLVDAPRALLEDTEATAALLRKVTADADVLNAPRILAQAGQAVQVESGKRIPFVRDFDVEAAQGAFIADPVIDTVFDGLSFETVAGPLPRNRLGVDLEITNGSVKQPIPEFKTTLQVPDSDQTIPVTVQLPSWIKHRLQATVALPDRGIAIFALPKFGDKGSEKRRIVTLQVRRVN